VLGRRILSRGGFGGELGGGLRTRGGKRSGREARNGSWGKRCQFAVGGREMEKVLFGG